MRRSSKKPRLKVVLDTNVWVSAMIWGGEPAKLIEAAEKGRIQIFVSEAIVEEISRILGYQRLREIYEGANLSRQNLIELVLCTAKIVQAPSRVKAIEADLSDNMFLDCALAAEAGLVISGDKHLLKLQKFRNVRILAVAEFIALLKKATNPTKALSGLAEGVEVTAPVKRELRKAAALRIEKKIRRTAG